MKSNSNTSKKQKLKGPKEKEENKVNPKYLSPQKNHKEITINKPNFKNVKNYILKSPIANKKQKLENIKTEKNNLKEQYSLYKKELQAVRDEEEKLKELKNKLKLQNDNYNNNINNINKNIAKEKISNTTTKIKRKKIKHDLSPSPEKYKKNILNIIEKSNKSNKKKLINYSSQNIHKTKPVIKQINNRKNKININLFSQKKNIFNLQLNSKDIKNKYCSPYKTIQTARNKSAKILFDFRNKEFPKKNKKGESSNKIGILTKAGMEDDNKKKINQDNYFNYDLKNGYKFIGVCDGHGENGKQVSEFIKNNLPKELENEFNNLITNEKKRISILEGMLRHNDENNSEKKEKFNIEKYIDCEKMNELLKKVYINTNLKLFAENMKLNLKKSGSTCISILYKRNPNSIKKLYISNTGDSRAIIIKGEESIWSYEQLSREHKLSEKDEAERIIKYGGEIQQIQNEKGIYEGPLRIFKKNEEGPGLAMSRSFGDSEGQSVGIIVEPEVKEYLIKKEDKALIIATDGLWEYTPNEEVVNVVKKLFEKKDANIINYELYKVAINNWKKENCSIDDITIICVILN